MNKKEIKLSDHLAIKRSELANDRTLLAYLRTGLMFFVSALTIIKLFKDITWVYLGYSLFPISLFTILTGVIHYNKTNKLFKDMYKK